MLERIDTRFTVECNQDVVCLCRTGTMSNLIAMGKIKRTRYQERSTGYCRIPGELEEFDSQIALDSVGRGPRPTKFEAILFKTRWKQVRVAKDR